MKSFFLICLFLLSHQQIALADKKHAHKKHHHDHGHDHHHQEDNLSAHVHGIANLSIVVDAKMMAIELKAPAESLLGFEHAPESEQQKNEWNKLKTAWRENLWNVFSLPVELECLASQQDIILKVDDGHADIEATALMKCQKDLSSQMLDLQMMTKFERLQTLKLEVLPSDQKAYSKELKRDSKNLVEKISL